MKVLAMLLYLWIVDGSPQVKLEQVPLKTDTECSIYVGKRVKELESDPSFVGGFWAGCVQLPITEAKR